MCLYSNSSVVIECFDYFSKSLSKETILILDNAPTHKSKKFEEKIQEWESKGLHLKFLPPYSPELNKIEILWRLALLHEGSINYFLNFL